MITQLLPILKTAMPVSGVDSPPVSQMQAETGDAAAEAGFAAMLADLWTCGTECSAKADGQPDNTEIVPLTADDLPLTGESGTPFSLTMPVDGKNLPEAVGSDLPEQAPALPNAGRRASMVAIPAGAAGEEQLQMPEQPAPARMVQPEEAAGPSVRSAQATRPAVATVPQAAAFTNTASAGITMPTADTAPPREQTDPALPNTRGEHARRVSVDATAEAARPVAATIAKSEAAPAAEKQSVSAPAPATVTLPAIEQPGAASPAGGPIAPTGPTAPLAPTVTGFNSLAAGQAPQDFEALIDRLSHAREIARPAEARLSVNHTEFGAVSIRFENAAPSALAATAGGALNVSLTNADPEFSHAVQAALVDRAGPERTADRAADDTAATRHDHGGSASHQARNGERQESDRRSPAGRQNPVSTPVNGEPAGEQIAPRRRAATGIARGLYI